MIHRVLRVLAGAFLLVGILLQLDGAEALKQIKLRNGVIETPQRAARSAAPVAVAEPRILHNKTTDANMHTVHPMEKEGEEASHAS